jgi:hypothetical protein
MIYSIYAGADLHSDALWDLFVSAANIDLISAEMDEVSYRKAQGDDECTYCKRSKCGGV